MPSPPQRFENILHVFSLEPHISQAASRDKTNEILTFLRFRNLLASGEVDSQGSLSHVVFSLYDVLLGPDNETKFAVHEGLRSEDGQYEGVSCTSLFNIAKSLLTGAT